MNRGGQRRYKYYYPPTPGFSGLGLLGTLLSLGAIAAIFGLLYNVPALVDLRDVLLNKSTILDNQVLAWNSSLMKWKLANPTTVSALKLEELQNVNTGATSGQVIVYNNVSQSWDPQILGVDSIDAMQIQKRVTGTCPSQSQIRVIEQNGDVQCDSSVANNAVGTSQIIDSSVTNVAIDSNTVQERVTGSCPAGYHIVSVNVDGTVVCDASVAPNQVGSAQIIDSSVTGVDVDSATIQLRVTGTCPSGSQVSGILINGAVTCDSSVGANQVGSAQLQTDSVHSGNIVDGTILFTDTDTSSVQRRVTGTCPAFGAQISSINEDGTVNCSTDVLLLNGSVTAAILAPDSVGAINIIDNSITEIDMSTPYKRGVPNGVATLDAFGQIPVSQLPPISVTSVTTCPNITCRNATVPLEGDVVIVLDRGDGNPETYIWDGSLWTEFLSTGVIISNTDDVPEGVTNKYYTDTRVSANSDVSANTAHRNIVSGNPHQLSLNDLLDVDAVTGGPPVTGQILAWNGMGSFVLATDMGEENTGANVGIGNPVFKQKSGLALEFYSLASGSSKLTVAGPTADSIVLDVNSSAILADLNSALVVDHSSVFLSGANGITVSGSGDLTMSRTLTFSGSLANLADVSNSLAPISDDVLVFSGGMWTAGQKRSGMNTGSGTGNVFSAVSANALVFRTLVDAGSGRVSVVTLADTVTFDVNQGAVNHNALLNYVAAQHVDHSTVVLSGATGIIVSGSGDLTASRTISRDPNVIQTRITGTCPPGQAVQSVGVSGTVSCASIQSVSSVTTCPNITCRNSTIAQEGDVVVVLDRGDGLPDTYIWDGIIWVEFLSTGMVITSTDDVPEGTTNLYYTESRVSANVDVSGNTAHRNIVTGNPHQLSINDLTDVDTVTGGPPSAGQILGWDGIGNFVLTQDMGEDNTGQNLGGGVPIFKQKNGVVLEFHTLAAGSTKLLLSGPTADTLVLDVNDTAILNLFNADQLVDHSTIVLSGANGITVSGSGDLTQSRTLTFNGALSNLADVSNSLVSSSGDILLFSGGQWTSGARRTVANVGTGAGLIFKALNADIFQLRSIIAATGGRLSVTTLTDEVQLDVQEAQVDHNALLNYEAGEHVNHASVVLSGASGILVSGSGDLTVNRTISRDPTVIQSRVTGTCPAGQAIRSVDVSGTVICTAFSVTSVTTCPNITCRNSTAPQEGDVVVVLDRGDGNPDTYIWDGAEWAEFMSTGMVISSTDDVAEGMNNLYYTNTRVSANSDVTANTAHRNIMTGNPHQLSLNDLLDVDLTGGPTAGQVLAYDGVSNFILATNMGESNTGQNVGGGIQIFKQKSGVNLEFYTLTAASTKLTLAGPSLDQILIDINETAILDLFSSDQLIDHSTITLTGANGISVSGSGDLTASRTLTFSGSLANLADISNMLMPMDGDILVYNGLAGEFIVGSRRTAQNVGMGAGNIFKHLLNNALQFRTLVDAGSGRLSISTSTDTVILDVQEGSVDHNALFNYNSNEHIDHAGVILSGASGITVSGSGDLTASRTISRDINVIQSRVTGTCAVGQIVSAIAADGTVTCHTIAAGDGINVTPAGSTVTISSSGDRSAAMGSISFVTFPGTVSTTITVKSTGSNNFVEVAPATTLSGVGVSMMNMPANGRLAYTGTGTVFCHVRSIATVRRSGGVRQFVLSIGVNGVPQLQYRVFNRLNTNGDIKTIPVQASVALSNGDYVSLFVGNTQNTNNLDIHTLNIQAMCMDI